MGVYIKDMEMPKKDGIWATLRVFPDGKCFLYSWCEIDFDVMEHLTAVPVPPHGRLIDADELKALVYANIALFDSAPGRMGADQKLVRAWLASMAEDIDDAPTIIPAEEGET